MERGGLLGTTSDRGKIKFYCRDIDTCNIYNLHILKNVVGGLRIV